MSIKTRATAPRPATVGGRIRASDAEAVRQFVSLYSASLKLRAAQTRSWSELMLHGITAVHDDYLECVRIWRGGTLGSETVYVARPERLRASEVSRDGVTYVKVDSQTRTASKAGEDDETQRVTPAYIVGELIEVTITRGKTGIQIVDEQRGRPIDTNADGRVYASDPPAS